MPITEIVRVLARGTAPSARGAAVAELFYDVDGRMGPDEQATSRPWFWVRLLGPDGADVRGPYADEPEALEAGEALGVTWG